MENRKQKEENEMEIDLVSLFFYLLDKWKLLFLGAVVGVVLAGALVFFQTPMYESNSTLYVLSKTTSITSITDLQAGTELTSDFSVIATSKPVIDSAIKTLKKDNIKLTRKEIKKMLTVANKTDTRMLSITVTSDDAKLSCAVADAITDAAVDQMASITQTDPPTIVEHPEVASAPVDNGMMKKLAMGIVLGIFLVGMVLTIRFIMNDKIQTEEDIEDYLETSVLAVIPVDKNLLITANRKKRQKKRDIVLTRKEKNPETANIKGDEHRT